VTDGRWCCGIRGPAVTKFTGLTVDTILGTSRLPVELRLPDERPELTAVAANKDLLKGRDYFAAVTELCQLPSQALTSDWSEPFFNIYFSYTQKHSERIIMNTNTFNWYLVIWYTYILVRGKYRFITFYKT